MQWCWRAALLAQAPPGLAADGDVVTVTRNARQAELDAITRDIQLTKQRQAELQEEIDGLDKDRATLNQTLIDAGQQVQELEGKIDASERRLTALLVQEDKLRTSLQPAARGARRGAGGACNAWASIRRRRS